MFIVFTSFIFISFFYQAKTCGYTLHVFHRHRKNPINAELLLLSFSTRNYKLWQGITSNRAEALFERQWECIQCRWGGFLRQCEGVKRRRKGRKFANVLPQVKYILVLFSHLKLWIAYKYFVSVIPGVIGIFIKMFLKIWKKMKS